MTSVANPCGIQDLRWIQYGIQSAATVCRIHCIQGHIGGANPIRKDVSAKWPNWLPEGVVAATLFRKVVHLPVAPEGVVRRRCRCRLP